MDGIQTYRGYPAPPSPLRGAAASLTINPAAIKTASNYLRALRRRVGVVLASAGYPGAVKTGLPIEGLEAAERIAGTIVFHSGTSMKEDRVVTAGGRVLTVVAGGASYGEAIDRAYRAVGKIRFDGMQYRRDIGATVVNQNAQGASGSP